MTKVYPAWYIVASVLTLLLAILPAAPNPEVGKSPHLLGIVIIQVISLIGTLLCWTWSSNE